MQQMARAKRLKCNMHVWGEQVILLSSSQGQAPVQGPALGRGQAHRGIKPKELTLCFQTLEKMK